MEMKTIYFKSKFFITLNSCKLSSIGLLRQGLGGGLKPFISSLD